MRIIHITAGAGGRICGSCLHDNALVRALRRRGRDALLVPAYVPTTTDEENVAESRVVMGGMNVWLQEHVPLFRHTPALFDRWLDAPALLRWLSGRTGGTRPADLGALTVSTLEGERGHQRKEVAKLAHWLASEARPDVVHLSNALLMGLARTVKSTVRAPTVCTLSGEDIFIEKIPPPHYARIRALLRERAADVDRFVALDAFYAGFMADYLDVPRERIVVIPHGVDLELYPAAPPDLTLRRQGRGGGHRVGYLARACPEKGLDRLVEALPRVAARHDVEVVAAGATVDAERDYIARCLARAMALGVADRFRWLGQVDLAGKLDLLGSVDVFAMPTTHAEAKGLPVIEAMAAGLPVVASAHGSFPELLDGERAGSLHVPGDPADMARVLHALLSDPARAAACGRHGHALARTRHSADGMAAAHEALYDGLKKR
jgi:glycosyltransferase involved in cell wall biosynthesis